MTSKIRGIIYGSFLIINAMALFEGMLTLKRNIPYVSAYLTIFLLICIDAIYNAHKESKRNLEEISKSEEM